MLIMIKIMLCSYIFHLLDYYLICNKGVTIEHIIHRIAPIII